MNPIEYWIKRLIITELVNLTDKRIGFEFVDDDDDGRSDRRRFKPPKDVPPNKTTKLLRSSLAEAYGYDTKREIRILMDGKFTGKKIKAASLICCVRIVFTKNGAHDQLSVLGTKEKSNMDLLLRVRGIGVMLGRKRSWAKKPLIEIATQEQEEEIGRQLIRDNDKRLLDDKKEPKKIINDVVAATQNTTKIKKINNVVTATQNTTKINHVVAATQNTTKIKKINNVVAATQNTTKINNVVAATQNTTKRASVYEYEGNRVINFITGRAI